MSEKEEYAAPAELAQRSRLSDKTRAFVQLAFASGVVDKINEEAETEAKNLKDERKVKNKDKWERQKWLLVRNVTEDGLTLESLKKFAGVTTRERARQIYNEALTRIWEASPLTIQLRFPKKEVLTGRIAYGEMTPEKRAKMITAQREPESRAKMRAAAKERWRRWRQEKSH